MNRRKFLKIMVGAALLPVVSKLPAALIPEVNGKTDYVEYEYKPDHRFPPKDPELVYAEMTVVGWPSVIGAGDTFSINGEMYICTMTEQSSRRLYETRISYKQYAPNPVMADLA